MTIDPVGQSAYTTLIPNSTTVPKENSTAQDTTVTSAQNVSSNLTDEAIGAVDKQNDGDKVKGVLRLLQAGHFHGVADVRLRINFHDEIAAMESERYAQTAQQGIDGLQTAIGDQVSSIQDNPDLADTAATDIGGAMETFNAALTQHAADATGDTSALIDRIRTEFDSLVSSLKTALGIQAQDNMENSEEITPADEMVGDVPQMAALAADVTPVDTPETTSAVDYQAFIDTLISTFETKLQEFETSLTDISVLPDLSAPHGNGKAYDKFVAMYNDMRTPPATATPEPAIDTNA